MSPVKVFMQGGLLMFPLVFILCVILGIACLGAWRLLVPTRSRLAGVQRSLDRLLMWGGLAVIIGLLGSAVGYHKVMAVLTAHRVLSPRALWIGTAEGMVSTLAGAGDTDHRRIAVVPPARPISQGPPARDRAAVKAGARVLGRRRRARQGGS